MSESELDYTIKALSKEKMSDPNGSTSMDFITDQLYITLCLWDEHPLPQEIAKIKGQQWLDDNLLHWAKQWVPYALKHLPEQDHAIESTVVNIVDALEKFPDEIGRLVDLAKLAEIRRSALARAGTAAYTYLQTGESQMAQPCRMTLADALLADVPRDTLGNPPKELCEAILDEALYRQKDDSPYAATLQEVATKHLAMVNKVNKTLNPLLA